MLFEKELNFLQKRGKKMAIHTFASIDVGSFELEIGDRKSVV